MRRELMIAVVAMGAWCACKYDEPHAGDDAMVVPISVGFASGTTLVDENSGLVSVAVVLSANADHPVSVDYAITGGTATAGADYNANPHGTIDFSPGQTMGAIELMIINDGVEEPDETIDIMLSNAQGGDLGTDMHVVTISANILPRVSFTTDTMSAGESANAMIDVKLDKASPIPVSVDYSLSGTATQGADYTLNAGTITFAAGTTTQQLALGVVNDALNEDNETVTVTLANPTNALLGAVTSITDTIMDDDPEPDVQFTAASASSPEATATVNLTVSLSAPSGRMVTVPFSAAAASTAISPDDYSYMTASPLVFPAGTTTQTITIAVVNDLIDEPNETVITALGTPTNANLGAPATHTLTIVDDDPACYGTGNSMVCIDAAPTMPVTLPSSIDTTPGASPLCAATQAIGWTTGGQPASCFVIGTTITQTGQTLVKGTRPLVLVASDTITISALLDVASHRSVNLGPGSPGTCKPFVGTPGNSGNGGGGGAGGSFMSAGGDGAKGDNGNTPAGTAATADAMPPTVLRAGCDGQKGGNGSPGNNAGAVGHGGGVVYLVAGNAITITNTGVINASGSSGSGGGLFTGGSGGGSGGMIKLYANTITATGGVLFANGGGAASGGDMNAGGGSGFDPTSATSQAAGGTGGGGNGGAGFANAMPAVSGTQGGSKNGGGGGGGGGGYIEANLALTGATVSAGLIQAP